MDTDQLAMGPFGGLDQSRPYGLVDCLQQLFHTPAYLPLGGLHPEDAYTLASRLLEDLGIDRARAPYAELRDLLVQLDHHPLAIQLVLPALHDMTLARIKSDFAALLPKFVDDTTTGRN